MKTIHPYLIGALTVTASTQAFADFKSEPLVIKPLRFSEQKMTEIALPEFVTTPETVRTRNPSGDRPWRMPVVKIDDGTEYKMLIKEPDGCIDYTLLIREVDLSKDEK